MTEREIRIGDRYLIEVEVEGFSMGALARITVCNGANQYRDLIPVWVLRAGKLIEKPLQVGDFVKRDHAFGIGRIAAVEGTRAWVKWTGPSNENYQTVVLSDLERAP